MRYLGLDLGSKTLGLSLSDDTGTIATPLKILRFAEEDYSAPLTELKKLVEEFKIGTLVLGFPKNMNNTIGPKGENVLAFQKKLEQTFPVEVVLQDERLSTVEATSYLLQADLSRKKRKQKIDALAANIILQTYLDRKKGN